MTTTSSQDRRTEGDTARGDLTQGDTIRGDIARGDTTRDSRTRDPKSQGTSTQGSWSRGTVMGLGGLLLAWFAAASVIGAGEFLTNDTGGFFAPIAVTAAVPVAIFLAAYALVPRVRAFVLAQDIRTLTMLQHWRVIGFVFLPLAYFGLLPWLFAWPAGLGDVAIGIAAAFVVARLARQPDTETSAGLVRFHLLGLLDFAVAIAAAGLSAGAISAFAPLGVTSAPMDVWPLNLFPSFGVPIFIILHLSVLLKVRHLRRAARQETAGPALATA